MRKFNRNYNYDNAAKINDIIPFDFCDGLNIKCSQIDNNFNRGKRVKRRFVQRIFFDFLKLVIDDCINRNAKFISPSRYWWALYIKEKRKKSLEQIVKNGKTYNDVDFIRSDGKIYEFVFYSPYLIKRRRYRAVRIGWKKYKELVQKVNDGMRYFVR